MSKKEVLLKAFQKKLGKWVCAYCNSDSNQPAATFRELKKMGYKFEEVAPNRWGKEEFCKNCNANRTHYKLLQKTPTFANKPRINISKTERTRIINIFNNKDAFTGASISSTAEIDHKIPWSRLEKDVDTKKLKDTEIKIHFQLLTREHNLLKDRKCGFCIENNLRPPFMEISYWYKGNNSYKGSCEGCGWFDGNEWRKSLNKKLQK